MESSEADSADDTSMDAFLDKFQSQPYRGGFREDQWEEVGCPGSPAGVGAWSSCLDRRQRTSDFQLSARSLMPRRTEGLELSAQLRPQGLAVSLVTYHLQVLVDRLPEFSELVPHV